MPPRKPTPNPVQVTVLQQFRQANLSNCSIDTLKALAAFGRMFWMEWKMEPQVDEPAYVKERLDALAAEIEERLGDSGGNSD